MADKIMADGMRVTYPADGSPSFVIARVGINVETFTRFLEDHANERGYVDLDILESQGGKPYAALNRWEPKEQPQREVKSRQPIDYPKDDINPDDIPF